MPNPANRAPKTAAANRTEPRYCVAPVGSVTQAVHARDALAREGVPATVVRNDPATTRHGCDYAISYPCERERTVRAALRSAGIRWRGSAR